MSAPHIGAVEEVSDDSTEVRGPELRRALGVVTLAWVFGSVWITATAGAPLAIFARSLNASEFQFGLLSALPFIASLLSMPASALTERTGQRKKIFLWGSYINRLMWFPLALIPFWMVAHYGMAASGAAMSCFLAMMFIMHASGAIGGPAWMSWMADVVPERSRGRYFSRRRQWGILSAIPAAFIAGWVLDAYVNTGPESNPLANLKWCAIVFMVAAVFGVADIHLFQYVPDVPKAPQRRTPLLRIIAEPLRDKKFLWFAGFVALLVFAVTFMGQFVTLYMIDKLKMLVAPMAAQLLLLPVWGKMADRMGKKPVLALASLGLVPVGFGWCLMSGDRIWLGYILSAAGAALWAGVEVANLNLVLEMAGSNDDDEQAEQRSGSSYVAANSVIINIAGCMGGLASGIIAQSLRDWRWEVHAFGLGTITFYEVLFAISGFLRLVAAVVFLPMIVEPQARPTREALRFMTANIYNNLTTAILQPLRVVRLRYLQTYAAREQQDQQAPLGRAPRSRPPKAQRRAA
jgi:MFS family permease